MDRVKFLLDYCQGKVLHVGCGNSALHTILLQKLGKQLYGLDIYDYREVYPRFRQGKAEKLPYRTHSFETVILGDVLMHVNNHRKTLQEANRVLKSKGTLLITAPNFNSLWNRLFKTYGGSWKIWLRQKFGGRGEKPKSYVYQRKIDVPLLKKWLNAAGFDIVDILITHMTEDVTCLFDTDHIVLQRGAVMDLRKALTLILPESLKEQICIGSIKARGVV